MADNQTGIGSIDHIQAEMQVILDYFITSKLESRENLKVINFCIGEVAKASEEMNVEDMLACLGRLQRYFYLLEMERFYEMGRSAKEKEG